MVDKMNSRLKKILIVSIVFIISSIFIGCSKSQFKVISSNKIAKQNCKIVLNSLECGDKEALKKLFCNKVKCSTEIDSQIQDAINFFEGKAVSYDISTDAGESSYRNGKVDYMNVQPQITDIVTDANKKYNIIFYMYIVCLDDQDKVGVSKICIKSDSGEELIIGSWIE